MSATSAARRWLRTPALHFVVLGGLLFAGRTAWSTLSAPTPGTYDSVPRAPVVVPAERIDRLAEDFARQWGTPPDRVRLAALVEQAVMDEILEREARRLALDFGDRVVRQRLIQKMRAVADDPGLDDEELHRQALALGLDDDVVIRRHLRGKMRLLLARDDAPAAFDDRELAAVLARHHERFERPATVSFSHVFVGASRNGVAPAARAAALAAELATRAIPPAEAARRGDAFPLAARLDARSREAIARLFGNDFAARVIALEPGRWSEPIPSPFGLHLVWVHEREAGGLPDLDAVREPLVRLLAEEWRAERERRGLERLRGLYEVVVEW